MFVSRCVQFVHDVGQGSGKFKGLAVFSWKQYFDFPARWMTFALFLLVCETSFFIFSEMFSLLCCSFYFVWPLSTFAVDFACVILISSNGNICYSLFTLIVTFCFCFTICLFGVFSVLFKIFENTLPSVENVELL